MASEGERKMVAHCLFEQSGTFKNEFKKLGIDAYDYDILNDFGQTDYVVDLFKAIDDEYQEHQGLTLFDKFKEDDIILAFFPCTRFEGQALLLFRGQQRQLIEKSDLEKLEYDLQLHNELHTLYEKITKLAIICIRRNLKLIIENPYSTQHYLYRYWSLKPTIIDLDRRRGGTIMRNLLNSSLLTVNLNITYLWKNHISSTLKPRRLNIWDGQMRRLKLNVH